MQKRNFFIGFFAKQFKKRSKYLLLIKNTHFTSTFGVNYPEGILKVIYLLECNRKFHYYKEIIMNIEEVKKLYPHCKVVLEDGETVVYAYPENLIDVFINTDKGKLTLLDNGKKGVEIFVSKKYSGAKREKYVVEYDAEKLAAYIVTICKHFCSADGVCLVIDEDHARSYASSLLERL